MKPTIQFLSIAIGLMPILATADHPTISLDDGSPGPITTISAIPLSKGAFSSTVQGQFLFNNEISDSDLRRYSLLDEDIHSTESLISQSVNTAYGVTDHFTFGLSLPYIWRNNLREAGHHEDEGGHHEGGDEHADGGDEGGTVERLGDSDGLGDLTIYGQLRILNDTARDRHVAIIAGLKTPTGRTDTRTLEGELFEAEHQPGSGSWDPLAGLAFTQHWGRWSLDANGLYTFVTKGDQDTNLGDIFNYNAALSYRVLGGHDHHEDHSHEIDAAVESPVKDQTWDLILEVNGDWRDTVEAHGHSDDNTGGNLIYLSIGSRLTWGRGWAATISAGVPVVEDLNGVQSEPKLRTLVGISKAF